MKAHILRNKGKYSIGTVVGIVASIAPYFEGTVLHTYKDAGGVNTICTGDTKHATPGRTATEAQCKAWFEEQSVAEVEYVANTLAAADPTDDQLAAFADFTYNLGRGAWRSSGIIELMEQDRVQEACDKLLLYNKGPKYDAKTGKPVMVPDPKTGKLKVLKIEYKGLTKRRNAEWRLCMGKSWKQ